MRIRRPKTKTKRITRIAVVHDASEVQITTEEGRAHRVLIAQEEIT